MKLVKTFYYSPLLRFLVVGFIALFTDAFFLYALRHEIGLIPAKIVSYICAFTVGWLLNRIFTFRSQNPQRFKEWMKYAFIYIPTGGLHVLIFAFLTHHIVYFYLHPIWPLLITAMLIAFLNFGVSKYFVFKPVASV